MAARGSKAGQSVLKAKCAIDPGKTNKKKEHRKKLSVEKKHKDSSSESKQNMKPRGFLLVRESCLLWSGGCYSFPSITCFHLRFVGTVPER